MKRPTLEDFVRMSQSIREQKILKDKPISFRQKFIALESILQSLWVWYGLTSEDEEILQYFSKKQLDMVFEEEG